MTHRSNVIPERTVGLDLGDRKSRLVILDAAGEELGRQSLKSTPQALEAFFGDEQKPRARVVLEVGTHSPWISRLLQRLGHEVLVANARAAASLVNPDEKTDWRDAETLARIGRIDPRLLKPIRHRSPKQQADLAVLRSRDCLVRLRTQLVLHVRGSAKAYGVRIQGLTSGCFGRKAPEQILPELQPALLPVTAAITALSEQIEALDRRIEQLAEQDYRVTEQLAQPDGVGLLTALAFVLTVQDPERFRSRSAGAFVGLVRRRHQSGARDPELGITKAGDQLLRRLLVQCAHHILGPFGQDSDLRRWGLALARRGRKAAKKRAVVAVARRLAVLMHALWKTGEVYEPLRHSTPRETAATAAA